MATIHASIFPDDDPTIEVDAASNYPVKLRVEGVCIHIQGGARVILRNLETEIRAAYDALDKQEETSK